MSELKESLEKLDYWLFDNYPDLFESLSPGLTNEQIEEECEQLSFEISEEVREFYQWKNGANNIFYSPYLGAEVFVFPFHKAVDLTIDLTGGGYVSDVIESKQINSAFFMFSEFERWLHFVDCLDRNVSPVLILTEDSYVGLAHTSLTSMVLTTVECYEKEVLAFNEFGYPHLNNREEYVSILLKHNLEQDILCKHYGVKPPSFW
jgi:hypothetical protein